MEYLLLILDAATTASSLAGSGQIALSSWQAQIQVQVQDNRLRSTEPLRKLGCDMGPRIGLPASSEGPVGSWQGSPELQPSLNLGVACAARHLLQA